MARYIDADALIENIKRVYCTDCNNYNEVLCRACGTDDVMAMIEDAPTADVVPRAEVAREIFEEIDKRFEALLGFYPCNGEFEDAKGFVDFHWKYIKRSIMRDYDPDFEKKYTEPEPPEGD